MLVPRQRTFALPGRDVTQCVRAQDRVRACAASDTMTVVAGVTTASGEHDGGKGEDRRPSNTSPHFASKEAIRDASRLASRPSTGANRFRAGRRMRAEDHHKSRS